MKQSNKSSDGRRICTVCNGTGHDKNARPKVEFVPTEQEDGTWKRKHRTLQQGSGCLRCGGLGAL